jgi:hypothetical protein
MKKKASSEKAVREIRCKKRRRRRVGEGAGAGGRLVGGESVALLRRVSKELVSAIPAD